LAAACGKPNALLAPPHRWVNPGPVVRANLGENGSRFGCGRGADSGLFCSRPLVAPKARGRSAGFLLPPAIFSLLTNPGGLSARMVTDSSPPFFAHAAVQPFRALDGYPYPRFLFRWHTAAYRGKNGVDGVLLIWLG
jgi:hypothetical protein